MLVSPLASILVGSLKILIEVSFALSNVDFRLMTLFSFAFDCLGQIKGQTGILSRQTEFIG